MSANQPAKTHKNRIIELGNRKEAVQPDLLPDPENIVFSLDIGTRSIVGIVGYQEEGIFKVLGSEVLTHKNRSMQDGQIHDIAQVAEAVREVRERLEKSTGRKLDKVAIAAAGRLLRTCRVKVERKTDPSQEIDPGLISSMEIEGIQLAQMQVDDEMLKEDKTQLYCVGYSIINYYLNGFEITSLAGHRGKKAGMEILATFLPHIVVDSLYTVMAKVGLEVASLTLEPIAAINLTIPTELRMLNLALVDIGAGTSDIAITRDGSVIAYAMAPVAGDEITEAIAQFYLVDFNTAEKIKISVSSGKESVAFTDILGKKHSAAAGQVLEVLGPSVDSLAAVICEKIIENNGKTPNAVFLIGGGSQVPGLTQAIAGRLKLSHERVLVRGKEILKNIRIKGRKLKGPEAITPFGIALTAIMQRDRDFFTITLNGNRLRLFNTRKLTIADALVLTGFDPSQLIGRSGKSIRYELDGEARLARGAHGQPAQIFVNDQEGSLETRLSPGDDIRVIPAVNGYDAYLVLKDIVQDPFHFSVFINGSPETAGRLVFINGRAAGGEDQIKEGDRITVSELITLQDVMRHYSIEGPQYEVLVNGEPADGSIILKESDKITVGTNAEGPLTEEGKKASHGEAVSAKEERPAAFPEADYNAPDKKEGVRITVNGKNIYLDASRKMHIFVDLFNYINFDLSRPQGNIVLRLNGRQAAFTDEVKQGDAAEIYWSK